MFQKSHQKKTSCGLIFMSFLALCPELPSSDPFVFLPLWNIFCGRSGNSSAFLAHIVSESSTNHILTGSVGNRHRYFPESPQVQQRCRGQEPRHQGDQAQLLWQALLRELPQAHPHGLRPNPGAGRNLHCLWRETRHGWVFLGSIQISRYI